jgi:hypothetical protein
LHSFDFELLDHLVIDFAQALVSEVATENFRVKFVVTTGRLLALDQGRYVLRTNSANRMLGETLPYLRS